MKLSPTMLAALRTIGVDRGVSWFELKSKHDVRSYGALLIRGLVEVGNDPYRDEVWSITEAGKRILAHKVLDGGIDGPYNEPNPDDCQHDWLDIESQSEGAVKCKICGVYGERQRDGGVYWPVT
jgi:hypothetical protein